MAKKLVEIKEPVDTPVVSEKATKAPKKACKAKKVCTPCSGCTGAVYETMESKSPVRTYTEENNGADYAEQAKAYAEEKGFVVK